MLIINISYGSSSLIDSITVNVLSKEIDYYVDLYGPKGLESEFGKKSHGAFIAALKKFKDDYIKINTQCYES